MQEPPGSDLARVDLVFGPERGGSGQPQAVLRRLTGRDEIALAERPQGLPIEDSVHLAARSCLDLAGIARPEPADVEGLTPGDLNRLLIAIHCLNFGTMVNAVASCRAPACDQNLEIDLDLRRMLEAGLGDAAEREDQIDLEVDGKPCRLELARPRVRDLEAAARRAFAAGPGAELLLIERAVVKIARKDGKRAIGVKRALARSQVRQRIESWLLTHDPLARLGIRGLCPGCGAQARLTFDPATFLFARLRRRRDILDDIDLIASHYHWGEAEILDLPIARRHAYLARIEARLSDAREVRPFGRGTAA
jgi:hypothetical protein